eukprot:CAMPEP_0182483784 /NCGR_PEP_ID=MMETSP1319-20130603/42117_1 /TAXON_ID=172717 /ORGANISM="Bolidomonas pacifica, Strain RCC208" /LENGTH=95 /DNA_ID=CAMNT_0024685623 /DNA_START=157 /DNA_END=441 /DNA_ORIENTATION=-
MNHSSSTPSLPIGVPPPDHSTPKVSNARQIPIPQIPSVNFSADVDFSLPPASSSNYMSRSLPAPRAPILTSTRRSSNTSHIPPISLPSSLSPSSS